MTVKPRKVPGVPYNAGVLVKDNKSARSQHAAAYKLSFGKGFIGEQPGLAFCCIQDQVGRKDRNRRPSRDHCLKHPVILYPSAVFLRIDEIFNRQAHFNFVNPGFVYVPAGRHQFCAGTLSYT